MLIKDDDGNEFEICLNCGSWIFNFYIFTFIDNLKIK